MHIRKVAASQNRLLKGSLDDVDAPASTGVAYYAGRLLEAGNGALNMTIMTIGLDLAKSVFQAHGVDEAGRTVLLKKLHRKQMLPFSQSYHLA
ncbi:hypothetical protein SAMN05880593_1245 [Rhizobium sp. RU36D]|nr:hypothetical protein SAMN05880593_1245 [Rhizobium sp. RU36D]